MMSIDELELELNRRRQQVRKIEEHIILTKKILQEVSDSDNQFQDPITEIIDKHEDSCQGLLKRLEQELEMMMIVLKNAEKELERRRRVLGRETQVREGDLIPLTIWHSIGDAEDRARRLHRELEEDDCEEEEDGDYPMEDRSENDGDSEQEEEDDTNYNLYNAYDYETEQNCALSVIEEEPEDQEEDHEEEEEPEQPQQGFYQAIANMFHEMNTFHNETEVEEQEEEEEEIEEEPQQAAQELPYPALLTLLDPSSNLTIEHVRIACILLFSKRNYRSLTTEQLRNTEVYSIIAELSRIEISLLEQRTDLRKDERREMIRHQKDTISLALQEIVERKREVVRRDYLELLKKFDRFRTHMRSMHRNYRNLVSRAIRAIYSLPFREPLMSPEHRFQVLQSAERFSRASRDLSAEKNRKRGRCWEAEHVRRLLRMTERKGWREWRMMLERIRMPSRRSKVPKERLLILSIRIFGSFDLSRPWTPLAEVKKTKMEPLLVKDSF